MGSAVVDYILAFLLGCLVATGELISRYKDAPERALLSRPGASYLLVNGIGSVVALVMVRAFGLDFGQPAGSAGQQVSEVLLAGVGSIAFFRTSVFNVTIRDATIGIGPNVLLVVILTALDRAVDRRRARDRAERVKQAMQGFDYDRHSNTLKLYCLRGLMQNSTPEDAKAIADLIRELDLQDNDDIPAEIKSFILGLNLTNIVGIEVLTEAVKQVVAAQPPAQPS